MKSDGRKMQQQVRRSAKRSMQHHRILDAMPEQGNREFPSRARASATMLSPSARRIQPDRMSRWCKRGVRKRKTQRLADHLRSRGRSQELASAAGGSAGSASHFRCIVKRNFPWRIARRWFARCRRLRLSPATASRRQAPARLGLDCDEASAIIIAGKPLSQVAIPDAFAWSAANASADGARWLHHCEGKESNMPVVPCVRPSHGSVQ